MEYQVSVDIKATADKVWSVLTDVERWPEWSSSMAKLRRLDRGPFERGTRVRVKQPKLLTAVWTVVDIEPKHSFTWTATNGGVTTVTDHRLAPEPNDTVTVTISVRQAGPLSWLVGMLTSGLTRRYVNMEAEGLKRRCEEGPLAPTT